MANKSCPSNIKESHLSNPKDFWDKADIAGKVALPVVIALVTLFFNNQINQRQRDTELVSIATRIVSESPTTESDGDPLRLWAIDILIERGGMSQEAALQLRSRSLVANYITMGEIVSSAEEVCDRLLSRIDEVQIRNEFDDRYSLDSVQCRAEFMAQPLSQWSQIRDKINKDFRDFAQPQMKPFLEYGPSRIDDN